MILISNMGPKFNSKYFMISELFISSMGPMFNCKLGWSVEIFFDRTEQGN